MAVTSQRQPSLVKDPSVFRIRMALITQAVTDHKLWHY
jgi:hypothetical protein